MTDPALPRLHTLEYPGLTPRYAGFIMALTCLLLVASMAISAGDALIFPTIVVGWGGPWLLLFAHVRVRRRLRRLLAEHRDGVCMSCRHPLAGLPDTGRCPECGLDFWRRETVKAWDDALNGRHLRRPGQFWSRRFGVMGSPRQKMFDLTFGLFVPMLCLLFDPVVFTDRLGGFNLLPQWAMPAYAMVAISGAALLVRLALPGYRSAVFAGLLASAALFAVVVAGIILPASLLGILFIGLGLLGLTPWLTAAVFARNARAVWPGRTRGNIARAVITMVLVIGAVTMPKLYLDAAHARAYEQVLAYVEHAGARPDAAVARLRWINTFRSTDFYRLMEHFDATGNPRSDRAVEVFEAITDELASNTWYWNVE